MFNHALWIVKQFFDDGSVMGETALFLRSEGAIDAQVEIQINRLGQALERSQRPKGALVSAPRMGVSILRFRGVFA